PLYTSFRPRAFNSFTAAALRAPDWQQTMTGLPAAFSLSALVPTRSAGILNASGTWPRSYSVPERTSIIMAPRRIALLILLFPNPRNENKPILCYTDFIFSFTYLLAPHGVVQSFFIKQFIMISRFHHISFFQYVNPVGMHNCR